MTGHIFLEGEIGTDVTTKTVRDSIALYPEATEFIVHVNSGGGDVYEGYNIGQILKNVGKKTTAQIGALCASIASFAALCCDTVIMAPQGDFMIHLPTGTLSGNAEDLRRGAAQLDRIKSELIDRYMRKVSKKGVTREQLSQMIDKETSMSPSEAFNLGFVDDVQEKMKAVAKFDSKKFIMNTDDKLNEETKGIFKSFGEKLDKVISNLSKFKFKNVAITLADGSIINTTSEDPNAVVGSVVSDEQGVPLKPGTYKTADGLALVVSEGGKVESADPMVEDKGGEAAKLKEEIAALKQQLAQKDVAVAEQKQAVEVIANQVKEFKNSADELKALKDQFEKLKNETFGDTTVPPDAHDKTGAKTSKADPMLDAMASTFGAAYVSSRNN